MQYTRFKRINELSLISKNSALALRRAAFGSLLESSAVKCCTLLFSYAAPKTKGHLKVALDKMRR
jgi:hypothetical protein